MPRCDAIRTKKSTIPVSVVIPCYQCRNTIARAITSVAAQTCLPKEVVLVDDASHDGTADILKDLPRTLSAHLPSRLGRSTGGENPENRESVPAYPTPLAPRTTGGERLELKIVTHSENGGAAVARSSGWAVATQPYIAFLDADDSWHPHKLEIQYDYMRTHPEVDISAHRYIHWRDGNHCTTAPDNLRVHDVSCFKLLLSNRFPTPTVMLKRDLPWRFDVSKRYSEDYLLWLQIVCSGRSARLIDAPLAYKHEEAFGEKGLSGNLWRMERGELDTYKKLAEQGCIAKSLLGFLMPWSLAKFVVRVFTSAVRHCGGSHVA